MFTIQKFDPKNFDRSRAWDDRYRHMYVSQGDLSQYEKQSFWPLLEKKLNKNGIYLDAGCGIGGWILFLSEKGYSVEGIDSHPQAVRAMTEYDPDLSVKIAQSNAIPLNDESVHGVLSIGSLEYGEGIVEDSLREFHRVLKQDGFLCLEVPFRNTLRTLFYIPLKTLESWIQPLFGNTGTFAYYLFGRVEIEDMLMNAGFSIEHVAPHDLPDEKSHFGLYANWPFLRGEKPYELNLLGRLVKGICNAISPWVASAGIVVIAKKK